MKRCIAFGLLPMLVACGPMSPEKAADLCEERARAATGPTVTGRIGISSEGPVGQASVGITSDFIQGRHPQIVYEQCVREKSGQGPIRPLVL